MQKIPLLLAAIMLFSACATIEGTNFTVPPINRKKKRHKVQPSIEFSNAIKRYRKEKGFFPQDMQSFERHSDYTQKAMQGMRELGFTELTVSYLYLDSLVVDFAHKPIYVAQVNRSDYSIDLAGQLIYTKRGDSYVEYRVFDKKKGKINYAYRQDTTTYYRR
ncbi:hypothetical protein GFS24_17585 [Chitinophaga sp. SYP-B3965]|uniref:hypothetical protein n=1 Tax=Chitinophaga sp. SYP-B3965 TaxID=2663120 RepID=UPI001299FCF9|nr:hypothetical protein [Chitinophaga sp. SYP-B3965]MRG46938.1 hypothetical protein [Chitinophaga sp. SYP-B3965]